ncbi:MAG: VPDSG-CTERM sorting domain-containing protein [Bacteroidales bacterium]
MVDKSRRNLGVNCLNSVAKVGLNLAALGWTHVCRRGRPCHLDSLVFVEVAVRVLTSIVVALLLVFSFPSFSAATSDPGDDHGKHLGQQKGHGKGAAGDPVSVPDAASTLTLLGIGLAGIAAVRRRLR